MSGFPGDFWWGTGASSTQTEGAAPRSDWKRWEERGKAPPSGDGNGFGTRYAEDFALYAEHGLTHHRLSIEWARIEPEEGKRDGDAVEHYTAMLQAARDAGVNVWVCLHHFSLPGWFADDHRGFLDDKAAQSFWPRHVDFVAETFGDLVYGWKPINEPGWYATIGYLSGGIPPGHRDLDDFHTARRNIHRANHQAARLLRGEGHPVASIQGLASIHATDRSPEARAAAARLDESVWGAWMSLLDDPAHADDFDVIGFSYYSAAGIGPDGSWGTWPTDRAPGPMGYVPWPEGLAEVLHRLGEDLPDRPLLVSECGLGTAAERPDDDEQRADYIRATTAVVEEAIRDGIDVRGYFHWTGVDNYEWGRAFDVQFGIFDRDRNPKPSAELAKTIATAAT